MKTNLSIARWLAVAALATFNLQPVTAVAQGTAFSYQGQLNAGGNVANGNYDFTFALYATNSGGSAVAGPLTNSATVVTNGLFSVALDFGSNVFNGSLFWLQIGVRTNGSATAFTTLSPRQQLLPVPYALYAMTPAGPAGPSGPQGPQGPKGDTGATGTCIPHMQVFDASGTFVVPAGVSNIMVEIWGGGGGGISQNSGYYAGAGGGGGGYGKQVFNVTPGSSNAVVVGPGGNPDSSGGDSSFDGLIIAHGGQYSATGGIGGSCNATLNITGGNNGNSNGGGAAGCGGFGGRTATATYIGQTAVGVPAGNGSAPGGGGGSGFWFAPLEGQPFVVPAGSGAPGRVVVYY